MSKTVEVANNGPKEHPILFQPEMVRAILAGRKTMTRREPNRNNARWQVGDRLWVRENWNAYDKDGFFAVPIRCKPSELVMSEVQIKYHASTQHPEKYSWKPSIHIPRAASRILLEITELREEPLQSMSPSDIEREGTPQNPMGQTSYRNDYYQRRLDFRHLWDSINSDPGWTWADNPTIKVIGFKVLGVR
jgi:hypothetical protein